MALAGKRGVWSLGVVEGDPFTDKPYRLGSVGQLTQSDA